MKLSLSSLTKLSEMICGNDPFSYFPYRSSSYLTKFFTELDLDYIHDGSTRSDWVFSVLKELNDKPNTNKNIPPREIVKVIEQLLHPDYFLFDDNSDLDKSRNAVVQILKINSLTLSQQLTGLVKVVPVLGGIVGGAVDVTTTMAVGKAAKRIFIS